MYMCFYDFALLLALVSFSSDFDNDGLLPNMPRIVF